MTIIGPKDPRGASATGSGSRVFTCRLTSPNDARECAESIVSRLATKAYRRPLKERELEDLLGLALDNFDVTGRWRIRENGAPIDTRGELYDGSPVNDPIMLGDALLERPLPLLRTFTTNLLAYAIGRRVEYYDQPTVRGIVRRAAEDDYRVSSFVRQAWRAAPCWQAGEPPSIPPPGREAAWAPGDHAGDEAPGLMGEVLRTRQLDSGVQSSGLEQKRRRRRRGDAITRSPAAFDFANTERTYEPGRKVHPGGSRLTGDRALRLSPRMELSLHAPIAEPATIVQLVMHSLLRQLHRLSYVASPSVRKG